eukprot:TRINITY_DN4881_c0_g1_i2.p1 TRINITY_DN4881_c0_g1~~TRINITY_DN4881_c0_g1_i2.p1  ORF type:complete len:122 (+),score=27.67 TRINITY_DN4881_c0_g1_i2:62-427(+)
MKIFMQDTLKDPDISLKETSYGTKLFRIPGTNLFASKTRPISVTDHCSHTRKKFQPNRTVYKAAKSGKRSFNASVRESKDFGLGVKGVSRSGQQSPKMKLKEPGVKAVSYTHLTLPTICSV